MKHADDNGGTSTQTIRTSSVAVDTSLSLHDLVHQVVELLKDLFGAWSRLGDSCFLIERISGGLTNLLLKVSVKQENGHETFLTVRLYGPYTDYVINRDRELQAIKGLSVAGFGPKLLGIFRNGVVQSFIDGRTLSPPDLRQPNMAAEIARQLCKFHEVEIPGSKEPQLWIDVFKFFENASRLTFDDPKKQKLFETISFPDIHNEITELKELTVRLDPPMVFAHNDLLSGNLMFNEGKEELYIIDFEYSSYSYRGYDIGNHFNEYAGYECDYSLYPSREEQYHFFRHYLDAENPNGVSDEDLEHLYVESNVLGLASHLFWALWALIQAKMSPIDFDYMQYFLLRYEEYRRQKESRFLLVQDFLHKHG